MSRPCARRSSMRSRRATGPCCGPRGLVLLVAAPHFQRRPEGEQHTGGGADHDTDLLAPLGRLVELLAQVGHGVRELAPLVRDLAAKVGLSGHRATPPSSAGPPRPPAPAPVSRPSAT